MCESTFLFHLLEKFERGDIMEENVEAGHWPEEVEEEVSIETVLREINTHYFFDTLHVIKAYIAADKEKALDTINLLAKTMRKGEKILKAGKAYAMISDELEYVRLYLELVQMHYGKIEYTILNNSEGFLVPIFTVRRLVEAAFTRCLTADPGVRKLRVYIFSDITHNYIEIKDSGRLLSKEEMKQLMTQNPEVKRNEYLLYKNSGWKVEINSFPDEGNCVFLSRPRKGQKKENREQKM